MDVKVPIIIPAYEPDERLIELLKTLPQDWFVILVDDGSGEKYRGLFSQAVALLGSRGKLLVHEVNKGKGRALKTAFEYVLENMPGVIGVVTADSDGQHTAGAMSDVIKELAAKTDSLILGVRAFDGEDVPWKSRFGNNATIKVMQFTTGLKVSDTQTGLRGIPLAFMRELLEVPGERFEFEMEMLIRTKGKYPIIEVPIETIYDSKENHQTHFRPVVDSVKIYSRLGRIFGKFIVASLSSCILDLVLFAIFCHFMRSDTDLWYLTKATVLARVISATYNYTVNNIIVFRSREAIRKTLPRYACLACIQMAASALLVMGVKALLMAVSETPIKIVVDTILFLISYKIQHMLIFKDERAV